jgi:hypothetical protein
VKPQTAGKVWKFDEPFWFIERIKKAEVASDGWFGTSDGRAMECQ